jgi:hypothetical protein
MTVAQDTPVRMPTVLGTASADQVEPPVLVPTMTGVEKMPNPTAVQLDALGQEIPFRPLTSEGIDWVVQASPALVEARTELSPAAKQIAVVGQATELMLPIPKGGFTADQEEPPEVVENMSDPTAGFPEFPTATQDPAPPQESPRRSTALEGREIAVQDAPLLVLTIP